MRTTQPRRPGATAGVAAVAVTASVFVGLTTSTASANPGTGDTGCTAGTGEVYVTSANTVAKGQKVSFAGKGFAQGGNATTPAWQTLSLKIDALSSASTYSGTAASGAGGIAGTYKIQSDGSVSGSLVVPDDIDSPAVNPDNVNGPHFLRFLGSNPGVSCYTDDFNVSASAATAPTSTVTAVTSSSRGTLRVTLTVNGSGFAPNEVITVREALKETSLGTVTADAAGAVTAKTIPVNGGILLAGEHQLTLTGSTTPDVPAVAQVTVDPYLALSNIALGSEGALTVTNGAPGAVYDSIKVDTDNGATEVLTTKATVNSTGTGSGTFTLPDGNYLGMKSFTIHQSFPEARDFVVEGKISPSSATLATDKYTRIDTPDGAIEQGLYQSAYSAKQDALYVTTANVTATSTLYKLDPNTLAITASVVPAEQAPGAVWAAYGVGVDDTNGHVWVTNTRQNSVAIYNADDLSLVKQFPSATISHSRDVVYDPTNDVVYVSSASEGSTGDSRIAMFEADDKDGDGTKYEYIKDLAVYPRTELSAMSLELNVEKGKLFTVSSTSQTALVIDTATANSATSATNAESTLVQLPDLQLGGGRGASGVAYDASSNRLFIASQNSDEVMITQLNEAMTTGTTVAEVPAGAGSLNIAFDPVNKLAYVANFGGTTVTVVDPNGTKVANLPIAKANHVQEDGKGSVFVVNKDVGNQVTKLTPKKVVDIPPVVAGTPAVRGSVQVGKTLTASPGTWATGTPLTYQWLRNGAPIAGATKTTYTLTAADKGKKLSVAVSGNGVTGTSTATSSVKAGVLKATKPTISGTAKVSKKLTVKRGSWTSGTKFTYQWMANGKKIKGGTTSTLKVSKSLAKKRITVKVTGKKAGYTTVSKTSAKTKKVAR